MNQPPVVPLVLVIHPNRGLRTALGRSLTDQGLGVVTAESSDDAVDVLFRHRPTLAFVPTQVGPMLGSELARVLRQQVPELIVLMLSESSLPPDVSAALKEGVVSGILQERWAPETFAPFIKQAIDSF